MAKKYKTGMLLGLLCMTAFFGCGKNKDEHVMAESLVPEQTKTTQTEIVQTESKQTEPMSLVGTAEEVEETVQPPSEENILISLAGDCSLGKLSIHGYEGTFYEMYDKYGEEYFFKNVRDIFEKDDMTLVNFEGVLTRSNEKVEKQYNIKGKPEYIGILPAAKIDAVSFGNNHRIDYGEQGVADTLAAFEEINIPYAYDDNLGVFETESGVKVGFVSVNEVYDKEKVEEYLEQGIHALKEMEVNLILACCHWGIEGDHYPDEYQTLLGHKCIDWGADLVVGSHPHVLQGFENYKGKYIIYSLGNFCFGGNKNPKDKKSMIVQATFHLIDGKPVDEVQLQVIPCTISSVMNRNDYCPTVAGDKQKIQIITDLNKYSQSFGVLIDEDGRISHK